jgi:hypothetical protein
MDPLAYCSMVLWSVQVKCREVSENPSTQTSYRRLLCTLAESRVTGRLRSLRRVFVGVKGAYTLHLGRIAGRAIIGKEARSEVSNEWADLALGLTPTPQCPQFGPARLKLNRLPEL